MDGMIDQNDDLLCKICNIKLTDEKKYNAHKTKYHCVFCDAKFVSQSNLGKGPQKKNCKSVVFDHTRQPHPPTNLKCGLLIIILIFLGLIFNK